MTSSAGGYFVFVVDQGKAQRRHVEIGLQLWKERFRQSAESNLGSALSWPARRRFATARECAWPARVSQTARRRGHPLRRTGARCRQIGDRQTTLDRAVTIGHRKPAMKITVYTVHRRLATGAIALALVVLGMYGVWRLPMGYGWLLERALRGRWAVVVGFIAMLGLGGWLFGRVGGESLPMVDEQGRRASHHAQLCSSPSSPRGVIPHQPSEHPPEVDRLKPFLYEHSAGQTPWPRTPRAQQCLPAARPPRQASLEGRIGTRTPL
jgi:hypothetical protein